MERTRSIKALSIVALIVAVVGLAVGFAAFSTSLKISQTATVKPSDESFNVSFSSSSNSFAENNVAGVVSDESVMTATSASIDNSNYKAPVIKNLSAQFTEPGQSVVYTFYAYNKGNYDAYLKSIVFENEQTASSFKKCTAGTGTTDALVQSACNDIKVTVTVGEDSKLISTSSSMATISNHSLAKKMFDKITLTIEYENNTSSDRADGDFSVSFGDVVLTYGSVDNN